MNMMVCDKCGSDKVQCKQWVEINTGILQDLADSQGEDEQDNWCPECNFHCNIIDENTFLKKDLIDDEE